MSDVIDRQAAIDALHMDTSIIPYEKARVYADITIFEIRKRLKKLPSVQSDTKALMRTITAGIIAVSTQDVYSAGMRNGMRWCRALIDDEEPKFEEAPSVQPKIIRCRDCDHFIRSNASNATVCNKHDGLPYTVDGTDFCSHAERREDG